MGWLPSGPRCKSVAANTRLRCERDKHDDEGEHWARLSTDEKLVWESFDTWASQRRERIRETC